MAKYKCWDPEYSDIESAREYESYDAETAAHRYAEDICDDDCECYSAYQAGVDVKVIDAETDTEVTVHVWMEMVPHFRTKLKR